MKQTYQPKKRQAKKEHGFMKRMKTRAGRAVLKDHSFGKVENCYSRRKNAQVPYTTEHMHAHYKFHT